MIYDPYSRPFQEDPYPLYKRFRDGAKADPNGLGTLKRVLKTDDLTGFETAWRQWVLTLEFK